VAEDTDARSTGLQVHLSPLLLGSLIAGIATTLAVVIFGVMSARGGGPPRNPDQPPPPPPGETGLTISVGLWVIAWLAVLVTLARDQIMARLAEQRADMLARIEEYSEQRETDGYLRGMRNAGGLAADVRPLHRVPPPAATQPQPSPPAED